MMTPFSASRRHARFSLDDGMIPLINIVFLMLIFFMVAGKIARQEPVSFDAPESRSEKSQEGGEFEIILSTAGDVWLNGELVEDFAGVLAETMDPGAARQEQLWVVKADAGVEALALDKVLVPLREAGVRELSLSVRTVGLSDD